MNLPLEWIQSKDIYLIPFSPVSYYFVCLLCRARRFMWKVISRMSTQDARCSVILTTHSMEEAEALCTRIGISKRFKIIHL
jgi:hypothetical protein